MKREPSNQWEDQRRGDMEVRNVLEKFAKGAYGRKGRVFGGFFTLVHGGKSGLIHIGPRRKWDWFCCEGWVRIRVNENGSG